MFIAQTQGIQADEKLLTAVAGGTPPALYYADRFTVPQFAQQGSSLISPNRPKQSV